MIKNTNTIKSLTLYTDIPCIPQRLIAFRADIIEHVLFTFLEQLRKQFDGLFRSHEPEDVCSYIIGKSVKTNNHDLEEMDLIILKLYEVYPSIRYFHNHRVSREDIVTEYPLIQYRCKKGKAIIQCFGEGIEIVEQWLAKSDFRSWISYKRIIDKIESSHEIALSAEDHYYRLMDYQALNDQNYKSWQAMGLMRDRIDLLSRCVTGHLRILGGCFITKKSRDKIHGDIVLLRSLRKEMGYHHPALVFNLIIKTNLILPESLALGLGTSIGLGTQQRTRWQGARDPLSTMIQTELEAIEV